MKSKCFKFILLNLYFCFGVLHSQTYELLNEGLSRDLNKIYLFEEFEALNGENRIQLHKYLTKRFIENNWEYLPSTNTPDINVFLNENDLNELRKEAIKNSKQVSINFSKLDLRFKKVSKPDPFSQNNLSYSVISKPIFNSTNNWSIVYNHSVFSSDVGSTSYLLIFRRLNEEWKLFHKISLWVS